MEPRIIRACCPKCGTSPENDMIHYQNSGPIVRIYCRKCNYHLNESEAWENGYRDIIEYWNKIGTYKTQDRGER